MKNAHALMVTQGVEMIDSKGIDIGFLGGLSDFRSHFWPGLGGLNGWTNLVVIAVLSFQFGGLEL